MIKNFLNKKDLNIKINNYSCYDDYKNLEIYLMDGKIKEEDCNINLIGNELKKFIKDLDLKDIIVINSGIYIDCYDNLIKFIEKSEVITNKKLKCKYEDININISILKFNSFYYIVCFEEGIIELYFIKDYFENLNEKDGWYLRENFYGI